MLPFEVEEVEVSDEAPSGSCSKASSSCGSVGAANLAASSSAGAVGDSRGGTSSAGGYSVGESGRRERSVDCAMVFIRAIGSVGGRAKLAGLVGDEQSEAALGVARGPLGTGDRRASSAETARGGTKPPCWGD